MKEAEQDYRIWKNKNFVNSLVNNVASTINLIKKKNYVSIVLNYDEKSDSFINYLIESESKYSPIDILSDINLIPSSSEIEDPISWAARTSLPPI
mgnify:CR=1 FL=1